MATCSKVGQHLAGDGLAGGWQPYMREACSLQEANTFQARLEDTFMMCHGRIPEALVWRSTQKGGHRTLMSGTFDSRCLYQPPLSQLSQPNAAHTQMCLSV